MMLPTLPTGDLFGAVNPIPWVHQVLLLTPLGDLLLITYMRMFLVFGPWVECCRTVLPTDLTHRLGRPQCTMN